MPVIGPQRLGLLTFPQRWEPDSLTLRFLCLPKANPLDPILPGEFSFATANLVLQARVIRGLDHLPRAVDSIGLGELELDEPPVNKLDLFTELTQHFNIEPGVPPAPPGAIKQQFLKAVTASYLELTGRRELKHLVTGKEFECALHDAQSGQPDKPAVLSDSVTWGRLISYALRQPKLALALGLMGQATIELPDPTVFDEGGWLYLDLHATSDYVAIPPPFTNLYAARIPPLIEARSLYAAVLFPVDGAVVADDIFRECERYDRGFARMVHGAQTDDGGDAIRLAWDDEQIAEWLTRQVDATKNTPMGTAGYRVDVRNPGGDWNSLVQTESVVDLMLGPHVLGPFEGEAALEVVPAQISPARKGEFWLPPYFATWRGTSLALSDKNLVALHQEVQADVATPELLLTREQSFRPVHDTDVPLRYGETYEFRVRLADLTRGGPPPDDDTPAIPNAVTTIDFQRRTRPAQVNIVQRPDADQPSFTIARPRIGYPDAIFAGVDFQRFRDAVVANVAAAPADQVEREMSVPDPDVLTVEILVEVRALEGDVAQYLPLYTTTRNFDEDEEIDLEVALSTLDLATLNLLAAAQPNNGPLAVPTARDIRLTLVGLGRDDPGYFASDELRRGLPITIELRVSAQNEAALFTAVESPLRSFFFQPPPADGSVASPAERLAEELDLDHSGLTLTGRPGQRTVFACSAALRHTLSPERASLTFASEADVIQRWINVLSFELARDWTWDGLAEEGIAIQRIVKRPEKPDLVELAGTIRLPHTLAASARAGVSNNPRDLVRQSTELLFFDAFDPKPEAGEFPTELTIEYVITPAFKGEVIPPDPTSEEISLPIMTPPAQVPKLISAGIALSPYVAADDYSSTEQRRRQLWLEFESPPLDKDDAYFVRVLANAPDPMLIDIHEAIPEVVEPPLPIDPEWIRLIQQNQPRDDSSIGAMDQLDQQAEDGPHYLVPLPKGLDEDSLELFGTFTYEIRVGHTDARWSSAQGRYGPALRVAGVQHPNPPLTCYAARSKHNIRVRAPYATAVHNGRNVRRRFPRTSLWAVLYARVQQTDAGSWRNLLVARAPLSPAQEFMDLESDGRVLLGEGFFEIQLIESLLRRLGLPENTPLTTIAVELFTDPIPPDPLGESLGHARMLRVSPLIPVPDEC